MDFSCMKQEWKMLSSSTSVVSVAKGIELKRFDHMQLEIKHHKTHEIQVMLVLNSIKVNKV